MALWRAGFRPAFEIRMSGSGTFLSLRLKVLALVGLGRLVESLPPIVRSSAVVGNRINRDGIVRR